MSFGTHIDHVNLKPVQGPSGRFMMTPKIYVLVVLLFLMAITATHASDQKGFFSVGVAVLTALGFDGVIGLFENRRHLFSDGGIVTGLIVALVLSSSTPWYLTAATTLIALASKHLFRIKKRPIFNPAAFGLLVAIFLFSSGQSWWGALSALPGWTIIFLLIAGFLVTGRVNKFPQVFAFLGSYFLLLLLMGYFGFGQANDALRSPFLNSTLFLAFFMVTDPPTSPAKTQDQVCFGLITALVTATVYGVFGGLSFLLIGLLAANTWNSLRLTSAVN